MGTEMPRRNEAGTEVPEDKVGTEVPGRDEAGLNKPRRDKMGTRCQKTKWVPRYQKTKSAPKCRAETKRYTGT